MAAKKRVSKRAIKKAPAKGLTAADRAATIVHLADTVKENVAHADTHVKMAQKSKNNPASVKHNSEHAGSHTKNALDHAKKLAQKLALDPRYQPAIKELNKSKKLGTS